MQQVIHELAALARATRHPAPRETLVIAPQLLLGRELVRAVAREVGGLLGWRATTLRALAGDLARHRLGAEGWRVGDDVDLWHASGRALREVAPTFPDLGIRLKSHGTRAALHDALQELRAAGVAPDALAAAVHPAHGPIADRLAPLLRAYDDGRSQHRLADAAHLLAAALGDIRPMVPRLIWLDDVAPHGLAARLRADLQAATDSVVVAAASDPSTHAPVGWTLGRADTPADEVREALRRLAAQGVPWDEVEFAATDESRYAVEVQAIAAPLGIPVTYANGLPLARTRTGERLREVVATLRDARWRADQPTTIADAASAVAEALGPHHDALIEAGEALVVERVRARLARLGAVLRAEGEEAPGPWMLDALAAAIADLRAWPGDSGRASRGGALHVTSLTSAGATGRAHVVLLGLDADRTQGGLAPDPVLPDALREAVRARVGHACWETGPERAARRRRQLRSALARLEPAPAALASAPRVHVSWPIHADGTEREASPGRYVLDLARREFGNATLGFDELRAPGTVGAVAGSVPLGAPEAALDGRDVWLALFHREGRLDDGGGLVRALHPDLARGLALREAWASDTWQAALTAVPAAAAESPLVTRRGVSATALERMGTCPRKWFFQDVIGLREAEEEGADDGAWLDAAQRGTVFHGALERFAAPIIAGTATVADADAEGRLLAALAHALDDMRAQVPPPSDLAVQADRDLLEDLVRRWLELERATPQRRWLSAERTVPRDAPVPLALPDGRALLVFGTPDRVDEAPEGLVGVDYKTGGAKRYRPAKAPLNGGRLLQPVVYDTLARSLHGGALAWFEYVMPGEGAVGEIVRWPATAIAEGPAVVASLMAHADAGDFPPTDDAGDCRFCAFAAVCRVRPGRFMGVESPPAAWAKRALPLAPTGAALLTRRGKGDDA